MTSTLTKEQKEIIEAKRQLALQRRNERQKLQNQQSSCTGVNGSSNKSSNGREGLPSSHNQQVLPNTPNITNNSFGLKLCSEHRSRKPQINFRQFVHQTNTSLFTGETVTGNCQLLSKERFAVIVPYQEQLIDIFKSIDSKIYGKLVHLEL
jgi:SWI/SNF-related matrix-associated actin-dependent regulator 1 of chromatin subfamily A